MFETIVWATDGSENADRALPAARDLARATGARVVAVHCREMMPAPGAGFPVARGDEHLVAVIRDRMAALEAEGIETAVHVVRALAPHTAEAIAQEARELAADAIVVGTHGHGPLAEPVVGSVTQRLLRLAPCPVLAVPTGKNAPATKG